MSDKSYIEALEAEIQKLHANEDHLKTVINLYADLSNVGRSFVENALSLCKRWDVDVDESLVYLYLFRYRVKMLEKFVDAVMVYYDDLSLYMYENVRLVWWIDC